MNERKSLALARPDEVLQGIRNIKGRLADSLFELADLLAETLREEYYEEWGYDSFKEWIETSGLDMSERHAYYLVGISEKLGGTLGITREELKLSSMSKLKVINRLDVDEHPEEIRKLVTESANATLAVIESKVATILAGDDREPLVHKTFAWAESAYEYTVKAAIDQMRLEYGDTIDTRTMTIEDVKPSRLLEMICANYLAGADTFQEATH